MEHIKKIKKRFGLPLRPFILTMLCFFICGALISYGVSLTGASPSFNVGNGNVDNLGYFSGLSFIVLGIMSFILWMEVGLNIVMKKLG